MRRSRKVNHDRRLDSLLRTVGPVAVCHGVGNGALDSGRARPGSYGVAVRDVALGRRPDRRYSLPRATVTPAAVRGQIDSPPSGGTSVVIRTASAPSRGAA